MKININKIHKKTFKSIRKHANEIKLTTDLINEFSNGILNNKGRKSRDHMPFSDSNNIEYVKYVDNMIHIKFKNSPKEDYYYLNDNQEDINSYSLSTCNNEKHRDLIIQGLQMYCNRLKINKDILEKTLQKIYDKTITTLDCMDYHFEIEKFKIDVTEKYKSGNRFMYIKAYIINVFPSYTFIHNGKKNNKKNLTKIATSYIIALGDNNKWNIFFDINDVFTLEYKPSLYEVIKKFNDDDTKSVTADNISIIIKNMGNIAIGGEIYHDNITYRDYIDAIDKPIIIEKTELPFDMCSVLDK